jgi:hypothetical protein
MYGFFSVESVIINTPLISSWALSAVLPLAHRLSQEEPA